MSALYDRLPDPVELPEFYDSVPAKRLIAWAIDTGITLVLATIASVLTFGIGFLLFFGVAAVIGFIYRWFTLGSGSATWGMRMMAIELREADGQRVTGTTALWHTLGYYISCSFALVQLASMVMMVASAQRQGLTDMVLGTAVINKPRV